MNALSEIYSHLQLKTPLLFAYVSIVHYDQIYSDVINEPFVCERYSKLFYLPKFLIIFLIDSDIYLDILY